MADTEVVMLALHMKETGLLCEFDIGFGTLFGWVFKSQKDGCSEQVACA